MIAYSVYVCTSTAYVTQAGRPLKTAQRQELETFVGNSSLERVDSSKSMSTGEMASYVNTLLALLLLLVYRIIQTTAYMTIISSF